MTGSVFWAVGKQKKNHFANYAQEKAQIGVKIHLSVCCVQRSIVRQMTVP